jgi:phospholipase C
VRVPTLLISPYIEPGTVFRSPIDVPYDHTSILATIRDWLEIPQEKMLSSARVKHAPTFGNVLTRSTPRADVPVIASTGPPHPKKTWIARNDLQYAMVIGHRKRIFHNLGNLARFKGLRTPPPRTRKR